MTEEVIEMQDSQPAEELELELEPETTTEGEAVDWKAKALELEQKNKQLYARLKKPAKAEKPSLKSEEFGEIRNAVSDVVLWKQKMQYGYEHGLSPEETEKVFQFAKAPTKETLDDPFIKAGLAAIRKERRIAEATPSPTGRSSKVEGKSFGELKPEERAKNFDQLRKNMLGK